MKTKKTQREIEQEQDEIRQIKAAGAKAVGALDELESFADRCWRTRRGRRALLGLIEVARQLVPLVVQDSVTAARRASRDTRRFQRGWGLVEHEQLQTVQPTVDSAN